MIYGTLKDVVVCNDIWNTMDKGVVVYYDILGHYGHVV